MSASKRKFFSGNTLEQAIISAASAFGIDPSEVAYKKVEKKHGFLKVRRRVLIEVNADAPRVREGAQSLDPMPKSAPLAAERIGAPPPEPKERKPVPRSPTPEPKPRAEREERENHSTREREPHRSTPRPQQERQGREEEPRRSAPPQQERGRSPRRAPREELPPVGGALGEAASEALGRALALIDLDVNGRIYDKGERLLVNISGFEAEYFLKQHGRALFSLEHLLPKMIRGLSGEKVFLKVDSEGFREDREEELREMAEEVAEEVLETGEPVTLDWLNPAERRIVHVTLSENPDVETESDGSGYLKRLTVYPLDEE